MANLSVRAGISVRETRGAEIGNRYVSVPPFFQCDLPKGGAAKPSIFQISPVSVTTYAVF